ncbi:MAG TPA: amylo-alpha-1,6-glucosidase, partial [Candidatus Limnocylindrales bacterium]|nr:amylo-alpha-1,6-glucosidase [Candidatus Limnocylindrales bacterium]
KLEWLETNGLGGFASSTVTGANTRRYHGLLTAATKPPVGRMVLLSKFEETFVVVDGEGGRRHDLSANQYPGAVHPQGHRYLKEFRLDPFPTFVYQAEGMEIEKRVFMPHGENSVVVEYELRSLDREPIPECWLELRPLIAFRDYHSMSHWNDALDQEFRLESQGVAIRPYAGAPELHFANNAMSVERTGDWYYNFEYAEEQDRGLDFQEDLFNPFVMRFALHRQTTATVIAGLEARYVSDAQELKAREIARRACIAASVPMDDPLTRQLALAADQFIVRRGDLHTVIAGYHWFADWGRDTMIALPGLTLATGRFEVARDILKTFAQSADQGMLPNRFPDAGEAPEYNTVDATLWMFEAVRAYGEYTGDYEFIRKELYAKLEEIVDWHMCGTRYGIKMTSDGLLICGEAGVQLTWMDAKIGDWVVTPRTGKPVEIQALWYNAICVLQELAKRFGDSGPELLLGELGKEIKRSFNRDFWNEEAGCLYDVVEGDCRDASIRPNQIFAVSLRNRMLSMDRAKRVVDTVRRELLTPLGLRSLSPHDPHYRASYEGGVYERDSAYHQGTVWPWLMGPFISAYVAVNESSDDARMQAEMWLEPFREHMVTAGLGQISEIADGGAPYQPRGCMAQAWSVAELLRAIVEDVQVEGVTVHDDAGELVNAE